MGMFKFLHVPFKELISPLPTGGAATGSREQEWQVGGDVGPQCHQGCVPAAQAVSQCGTQAKRRLGTAEVTLDVAVYCFKDVGRQAPIRGHLERASFLGRCFTARSVAFSTPFLPPPSVLFTGFFFFLSSPES